MFDYTPRGKNHGYSLYQMAKANPEWFAQILTVNDTQALSLDDIQAERAAGMSEELIQQEFYCSFEGVQSGSVFGRQMQEADNEGRICGVPWQPEFPAAALAAMRRLLLAHERRGGTIPPTRLAHVSSPLCLGGAPEFLQAWHDVVGEAAHFRFERLELQQHRFDAGLVERRDPLGHLVVAADQACRRAAIGADALGLGHGLAHHDLLVGVGLHVSLDLNVLPRELKQALISFLRLGLGLARDDEGRPLLWKRQEITRVDDKRSDDNGVDFD